MIIVLLTLLVSNASALGYVGTPDEAEPVVENVGTDWNMFAPTPIQADYWYTVPARLESGREVDAFHRSGAPNRSTISEMYPNARWRKYFSNFYSASDEGIRRAFASYLCQRWNRNSNDDKEKIDHLTVYRHSKLTRLEGNEPVHDIKMFEHSCSSSSS